MISPKTNYIFIKVKSKVGHIHNNRTCYLWNWELIPTERMIYTMVQMYNFSSNERDIYFVRFISPSAVINVEPIFCKPLDISVWTQFSDTQCTEDIKVLRNINLFKLLKNLIQMRNHEVSQYFAVYLLSNLRRWSYIHLGESAAEDQHLDDPISPGCHDQVSNKSLAHLTLTTMV